MVENFDVIIAGGGPAGLSVARVASEIGAEVLLLELQAKVGQTQSSAWVSKEILDKEFNQAIKSSVDCVGIHSAHRNLEVEGNFGRIIDRGVFDRLLASEAVKAGVEIWVGAPVRGLLNSDERIQGVRTEAGEWSEEIESEVVVDATGAKTQWSSIFLREVLESGWDKEKIARTNEYLMVNSLGEKRVDIYFNSFLAPQGHAWIYPLERDLSMAGIRGVRIHPDSALDEFIGRESPDRLRKSVPIGAYRGQLPMEGPLERTTADGILAVGSSAGQVYPVSGHGMKYALKAGEIAGRIIAEGIKERDTSQDKLCEYDRLWRSKFEKEIRTGRMLRDSLQTSPDQKMNSLLEILDKNEELRKYFVNMFLGEDLEKSIKEFFKIEKCRDVFGRNKVKKILDHYS